jgi:DNA-binding response OmpR family regulator
VAPSSAAFSQLATAEPVPLPEAVDPTDLVERLRLISCLRPLALNAKAVAALACEAAAEIERLRQGPSIAAQQPEEPTIDWQCQAIIRDGVRIPLSASEWLIFARLVKSTGKLVTRQELLDAIYWWDPNGGAKPKIIDVLVCSLRKKSPWPITTVRASGYIIDGCRYERPAIPLPRTIAGVTRAQLMAGR